MKSSYAELLEYIGRKKVANRAELRDQFSRYLIQRLMHEERIDVVSLSQGYAAVHGPSKYSSADLFYVSNPFRTKLSIIFLKDEKEALIDYIASLIKTPLTTGKVKAISYRLHKLDPLTRIKILQRAGHNYSKYWLQHRDVPSSNA